MTQAEIDQPDGIYHRSPWGKYWNRLPRKGAQCVSGALMVDALRRLAREQVKPVTVTVGEVPPVKGEGKAMKMVGKVLLVCGSLYFLIHILIWAVKP